MFFLFYHAQFQRFCCIEMDISLGEGYYDAGLAEEIIYTEPDTAFDNPTLYYTPDAYPEMNLKYQGIVPKIGKNNKGLRFLEDPVIFF